MAKNSFYGSDLITTEGLSAAGVSLIISRSRQMKQQVLVHGGSDYLKGKILAALFFEPSTRTYSSFISAVQRLGGGIIPLNGMSNTSIAKGETLSDTVRVFSKYADVLVIRHPEPGSVKSACASATKPVINAGDGINEHPTQALIDLVTINEKFGRINKLHILMIGDLAHYRPTNSLAKLLCLYPQVKLSVSAPDGARLPEEVRNYLLDKKMDFKEYSDFREVLPDADVLYVTRVKKEYMSEDLYRKIRGSYIIDKSVTRLMKKDSVIMHCLPRIDEIAPEVDNDPRSIYLSDQLANSLYVRMAILSLILRK